MSLEIDSGHYRTSESGSQILAIAPGLHLPFNSRLLKETRLAAQRAAIFLDRDGVIVRDVHYLRRPSEIELLPNAVALRLLQDRFFLVVATNQSGIARNFFTEQDLIAIHSDLVLQLAALGVVIDAFYYCPHLPTGAVEAYRVDCECRKPKAGMLLRATADWGISLESSYMIGDSRSDMEAGRAAGLAENILLGSDMDTTLKYAVAKDLAHAARIILGGAA
jgi:D-glycero-D-manno-heptose 1,7-bisphosphate phosphatase